MRIKLLVSTVIFAVTVFGASALYSDSHSFDCGADCSKKIEVGCEDGVCSSDHEVDHKVEHKTSSKKAATINALALKAMIDSGADMIILDARSKEYDDGKRIPGAVTLTAQSTAQEIQKVISSKDKLVVTYCANIQCPASDMLYKHLKSLGYSNVMEYPEGIQAWVEAGYPVVKAKE